MKGRYNNAVKPCIIECLRRFGLVGSVKNGDAAPMGTSDPYGHVLFVIAESGVLLVGKGSVLAVLGVIDRRELDRWTIVCPLSCPLSPVVCPTKNAVKSC